MIEYILANIVAQEFNRCVGKGECAKPKPKMMHIAINSHTTGYDQYLVQHMYIYAPMNYVYVAVQAERIDEEGERHVDAMKILCYHDSCWRDAIQRFIYDNRHNISSLDSYLNVTPGWYDVLEITKEEAEYLGRAEKFYRDHIEEKGVTFDEPNPFDKRGLWAGKA